MADIKWIKLDVGIFEDEKIKIVLSMPEGKSLVVIWLKLLCLAGRINNSGVLMVNKTIPYTVEMLGAVFDESEAIMRLALDTFQRLGMVEQFNGTLLLPNWEKHQSEDRLKEIQEKSAARVAKHRERQRLNAGGNVTVTLQKRLCNAIEQELKQEQEQEPNKETKTKAKRASIHPMFDAFWQAYPKRIAKAKAEEAFSKLNPDEELMKVMLAALKAWSKTDQWTKESGQFVPNPTTWLNQRRWEDELPQQDKPKERKIEVISD